MKLLTVLPVLFSLNALANVEAHEWGTFTSLVGSNGVTQNGMYHEDEALPGFVHGFGELANLPEPQPCPPHPCHSKACFEPMVLRTNKITQKMETPVIYFYADQPQHVDVRVSFPEGVITETYPGPIESSPKPGGNLVIANGSAHFSVDVMADKNGTLPSIAVDNIYSHARATQSNLVSVGSETEKFIFYRGLGRFQPSLAITSKDGALQIVPPEPIVGFLVSVNSFGDTRAMTLPQLSQGRTQSVSASDIALMKAHLVHEGIGIDMRDTLIQALTQAGLFPDEATAMFNTWENGYLRTPGLRLLYILPRHEVDATLPLQFSSNVGKTTRVFVGRIEVMLDTNESALLGQISNLGTSFPIDSLGRFAEARLMRVRELAPAGLLPAIDTLIGQAQSEIPATVSLR